jgi:PAS domain S-box-containing protein
LADEVFVMSTESYLTDAARFRLTAILESSDAAIIGKDLDNLVTDWNRGAESMFGYSAAEMIGNPMTRLYPSDRLQEESYILSQMRQGHRVGQLETLRLRKDGGTIDVSITASPIRDTSGQLIGILMIARDISAQKTHERERARVTRLYAALSQVNQAIIRNQTDDELYAAVCRSLVLHGGFRIAWIGRQERSTQQLIPVAMYGDDSAYISSVKIYANDRPEGSGPSGRTFLTGRPYICNDVHKDPNTLPWREAFTEHGLNSSAVFPIRNQGQVSGILTVYSTEPNFFQEEEVGLLTEAADDISFAIDALGEKARHQQTERLADNERQFARTMIESMPGVIYFYDEHGQFLRWNNSFETITGYSKEEIARMHPLDFIPADQKEVVRIRIQETLESGESHVEANLLAKDGVRIPYFFTGRRIVFNGRVCLVGMGVDISVRRRAELALAEAERRFHTIFAEAPVSVVVVEPDDLSIYDFNEQAARQLGYTMNEFSGLNIAQIDCRLTLEEMREVVETVVRGDRVCFETQHRTKSGAIRDVSVTAQSINLEGRNLLQSVLLDITDRKRAEEALRELNETLEKQVAMRTSELRSALVRAEAADRIKSAFLATMSHELRTPLNSIIGFTGIVLQGMAGPLNAEQSKQLAVVRHSARHLLALINDILDLSKIEAGQLEVHAAPFSLEAAVREATALVLPLAQKKGLTLTARISPDIGEIVSDRRRVEQIMINLLNNAIKFTDAGSVQIIAEKRDRMTDSIGHSSWPAVTVRVVDTGVGIKQEDLATLFQPFRQIDMGPTREYEGTGLGLAICRRLAHLLGGEISVTSEWSKGSEFAVTIPLGTTRP